MRELVANKKAFPFSPSFAVMGINMMVPYLLALGLWPKLVQRDCQFTLVSSRATPREYRAGCGVGQRLALGDLATSHYPKETEPRVKSNGITAFQWVSGGLPSNLWC